jgi:tetratricopeptide (TPR) repeat protein
MKKILLLFIIAFSLLPGAFSQTAEEWQSDLRHLQKVVHHKYNNLFHTITTAEWDKAVDKFYHEIPTLDKMSTLAGFMKLVALFNVGHTQVSTWSFHAPSQNNITLNRYPYRLYWFSDGLYIQAADKNYAKSVGGKIVKIGKMKTDDALEAIRPLVSYENEQGFKSNVVFFLASAEFLKVQGIAESSLEIPMVISKDGKEETILFKAGNYGNFPSATGIETPEGWPVAKKAGDTPLWQKEPKAYRYFEFLPASKTLYVRHSVTLNDGEKTIADYFKKVVDYIDQNDVQRLVLDIRTNSGGNNYLNKNIITSIIASRKINHKGKFFCIIGRRTFSAAQNLVNELEKYTEVTFVGEPTSENVNFYGDTRTETLPNSQLPVNLSWMWWQNQDPRDKRKATYPQLAADMSFGDYYNNNDPALQVVMNYDPSKSLLPALTRLLDAGKKDEALRFAKDYQKDPVNKYVKDSFEPDINNEGYRLMAGGKKETASGLFEINTKLFPESANTYDSYAESLMELGRNEEALKYYEMAIAKDKDGVTADNSKKMIEKIKTKKAF